MGAIVAGGGSPHALWAWWVAALVVALVVARPARRYLMRRELARRLSVRQPGRRSEADAFARRAVPLWRRPPGWSGIPADPFALRARIVVPPLGDGRPGEAFDAPREALDGAGPVHPGGSRTDAQMPLAPSVRFAVVCLGRIGTVANGRVLRTAPDRVGPSRLALQPGWWAVGAATRVDSAAGPGWRQAMATARRVLTDTHIDRGGFAFVVGVYAPHERADLARVVDAVLATWLWLDDPAAPVAPRTAAVPVRADAAPGEVVVRVGVPDGPWATFLAPAPDSLPDAAPVPAAEQRPEALVALGPTAALAVVSEPLTSPASARAVGRADAPLGVLREQDGPARPVRTAAGGGWRVRHRGDGGFASDEVELDHGGRAWTIVLSRGPDDAGVAGVLDRALDTWRWDG